MSRDLGPTELRVCRMVFAFLAVMVFAFLLLNAIESLSNPSPPVRKVQVQPDITNPNGRHPKQSSQSSPPMQTAGAQSQKEPARGGNDLGGSKLGGSKINAGRDGRTIPDSPTRARPLPVGLAGRIHRLDRLVL